MSVFSSGSPQAPHDSHLRSAGEPGKHPDPIPGPDSCVSLFPRPQDTLRTRCVRNKVGCGCHPMFQRNETDTVAGQNSTGRAGHSGGTLCPESRSLLTPCLPSASCQVSSRVRAPLGMSLQGTPHLRGQCWGERHSHQETRKGPPAQLTPGHMNRAPAQAWQQTRVSARSLSALRYIH